MKLDKFCIVDPNYWDEVCKVIYIPTENCNVRCNYCSRGCNKRKDSYYYASGSNFRRLLKFLELQDYKHYTFEFFGGEPTAHHLFREFHTILDTEYFDEGKKLLKIHTLTNLMKPFEYWRYNWPKQTKFSCSYHYHAIKDPAQWFSKVYYLNKKGMIRDIKFILTPENEKEIVKIYDKYKSDEFSVYELVVQEQLVGTDWAKHVAKKYNADYLGQYKYEQEDTTNCEILFKDGSKGSLDGFQFHNFKLMMCNCKFRVAENGDVYYCWRKFDDPEASPILNIFKDALKKIPDWHICLYDNCDICDIHHPKYSIDYFKRNKNEIQR